MRILIFQTGEPLHTDIGSYRPMRAMNLADALVHEGHQVDLISSDFFHQQKVKRKRIFSCIQYSTNLNIFLVPSPGYQKNISIERFLDHKILAKNLTKILEAGLIPIPDIAFIGYPPIEAASVLVDYLSHRNIPTILDIKDQWPHIFVNLFPKPLKLLPRILFHKSFVQSKACISKATALSSISLSFLNFFVSYVGRSVTVLDTVLPLTTRQNLIPQCKIDDSFAWWESQGLDLSHRNRFIFIGSLSRSFNFNEIKHAFLRLSALHPTVELVISGAGELEHSLRSTFEGVPRVFFPGFINDAQSYTLRRHSLASLAPYKNTDDFKMSIPNKIIDSMAASLPIISSLEGEVRKLIEEYSIGLACKDTSSGWFTAFELLLRDSHQCNIFSENAYKTYDQKYSYDKVYSMFSSKLFALSNEQSGI